LLQLSLYLVPSAFECEFVHSHFSFGASVSVSPKRLSGHERRGVFESVADLRRKLMRYIKAYNKTATPLQWTYSNPTNRIAA
jgi:hypothetical protein